MHQRSHTLERKWNRQLTRPIFLAGAKNAVWKRDQNQQGGPGPPNNQAPCYSIILYYIYCSLYNFLCVYSIFVDFITLGPPPNTPCPPPQYKIGSYSTAEFVAVTSVHNANGNKLTIFSNIALYCGDTCITMESWATNQIIILLTAPEAMMRFM